MRLRHWGRNRHPDRLLHQSNGEVTRFVVDEPTTEHAASGLRVFAGPRWDPFIMDAPAGLRTIAEQRLAFTDSGSIFLDGKNVLGLVVER